MCKSVLLIAFSLITSLCAANVSYQTIDYVGDLFRQKAERYSADKLSDLRADEARKQLAGYYTDLATAVSERCAAILLSNGSRPSADDTFSIDIGLVTVAKLLLEERGTTALASEEADRLKLALFETDRVLATYFSPD